MNGALVGIAGALGLIAYVGVTGGLVDFFFPPQAEVTRSSSLSGEPAAVSLSHPLGCDLRIRDCLPSGRHCTQERCYVASSHKGGQ